MPKNRDSAFVICQVGAEGSEIRQRADEIYSFIVEPVTKEFDLSASRSDRDPTPGQVTAQIIRALTSARVVIADLTGHNPNVYYELGVAHSFAMPVVILVDSADSLSFDTSQERVIEIGKGDRLGVADAEKAKRKLSDALSVVLAVDYQPSSLVSEAAGARSLQELAPDNPVATELAYVRDRLEIVIRQTTGWSTDEASEWRSDANALFDLIDNLADSGVLDARVLSRAGFDVDDQRLSKSLRRALRRIPALNARSNPDEPDEY
ncbi:MAG TPA: hypothetical protein VN817_06005 [Solirubrobacteraceae bacterium]|nr:hypothetical protein [Solirubrobacteraceae bacterium]